MDFTTINFETANSHRGSPCSAGLVRVRGGLVDEELHLLMRPPELHDYFEAINVSVHGITPQMVQNEPRWGERLPEILEFIGGDLLVAHNAFFDIGVIRRACEADGIMPPDLSFLCTSVLSRKLLALKSYALPRVLDAYGHAIKGHHNALDDARSVTKILNSMAEQLEVDDIASLLTKTLSSPGRLQGGVYVGANSGLRSRVPNAGRPTVMLKGLSDPR